jgi:hypothetical protein
MRGREPLTVWIMFGVVALEILVTYSRIPAEQLYRVTGTGFIAGLSRVVVFLNFPTALVAIAIVAVSYPRLERRARPIAVAAALLCLPVFWPGVVSQSHLDARWINAVPAFGVFLAVLVTATTGRAPSNPRGDRLRLAIVLVLLVVALPWLAADLGFYFPGPHVHHGHHHGMDGVLLVVSALLLSRQATSTLLRAYLALMLAYGVGNILNDAWLEQIVRRGWTGWQVPSVLEPRITWGWAAIVAGALVVFSSTRSLGAGRTRPPSRAL